MKKAEKMEKEGVSLKFKGVKRNSDGEITSIKITAKTDNSTASYEAFDEVAIDPITIKIKDGKSISISDGKEHRHKKDYHFSTTEDGKHKVHTKKAGANVWVHSDDDHDGTTEVIREDDKIIIKRGDKIKEVKIKGGKGASYFFSDGDGEDDEEIEVIELDDEDGESIIIRKSKDGKVIQERIQERKSGTGFFFESNSDQDEEDKNIFILNEGGSEFIFSDSGKSPLYIIDGKEATKKEAKKLKSDDIESMNVMKGKSAEEKYGKKAKNGVIEITTKKN